MQDQMLSQNFALSELTRSQTGTRLGIQNIPTLQDITNLRSLAQTILEPLRSVLARPISISSGFRCPELNHKIGGAPTSQHQYGQAADIIVDGFTPAMVMSLIRSTPQIAPFVDQCILEFGEWTHVSVIGVGSGSVPRNQYLIATHGPTGAVYTPC